MDRGGFRMRLLSPEYLELQRDLHARGGYGIGVDAFEVSRIILNSRAGEGVTTVLDYGCGQGALKRMVEEPGEIVCAEYDPCIPGKDALPQPADIVVCSDVMEHVEEDCVGAVLDHIASLTQKLAIFVIATGPSRKIMADGRQAHITLHDMEWWRKALERVLIVERDQDRSDAGRGLLFICRPKKRTTLDGEGFAELGRIEAVCAVEDGVRNEQAAANSARIAARVVADGNAMQLPVNGRTAVLVCYGPSLQDSWDSIAWDQVDGADVFTASGSHRFLTERGVIPYAHIECDPRAHKATQMGDPVDGVKYWLASCVSPALLDKLTGHDVALWHAYNGEASHAFLRAMEPSQRIVVGGGSVALRALSLLYYLGYRRFVIHGMDFSFRDGEQHAGEHHGKPMEPVKVMIRERTFETSLALISYFRQFYKQHAAMVDAEFILKGDGMLQHAMRTA